MITRSRITLYYPMSFLPDAARRAVPNSIFESYEPLRVIALALTPWKLMDRGRHQTRGPVGQEAIGWMNGSKGGPPVELLRGGHARWLCGSADRARRRLRRQLVFVASHFDRILMLPGLREIVGRLQAQPVVGVRPTGLLQPDGHLGRYPCLTI